MKESHRLYGVDRLQRLAVIGLDHADWYDRAQREIVSLCYAEGWDVCGFTNRLAILSPKISIRRNVRSALAYVGQGEFFANTMPAMRRSMAIYEESGIVGGHKVPSFAGALLGDTNSIVLDTWMSHAMIKVAEPSVAMFRRRATGDRSRELVCIVGRRLRLCPRDAQAAIWTGVFRETGGHAGYFPVAEEYDRWLAYNRRFPLSGDILDKAPELDTSFNPADFF